MSNVLIAGGIGRRSRPAGVIVRRLIDFGRRHLPCDVSDLLADVVAPVAGRKRLQLGLEVDGGLPVEPGHSQILRQTSSTQPTVAIL